MTYHVFFMIPRYPQNLSVKTPRRTSFFVGFFEWVNLGWRRHPKSCSFSQEYMSTLERGWHVGGLGSRPRSLTPLDFERSWGCTPIAGWFISWTIWTYIYIHILGMIWGYLHFRKPPYESIWYFFWKTTDHVSNRQHYCNTNLVFALPWPFRGSTEPW